MSPTEQQEGSDVSRASPDEATGIIRRRPLFLTGIAVVAVGITATLFDPSIIEFSVMEPRDDHEYTTHEAGSGASCPSILSSPVVLLVFIGVTLGLIVGGSRRELGIVGPLGILLTVYVTWVYLCNPYPDFSLGVGPTVSLPGAILSTALVVFFFIAVVVHVVAGAWVWTQLSGLTGGSDESAAHFEEPDDLQSIGEVAGEIADQLEFGEPDGFDDRVIESWYQMIRLLDIDDPASATPGEFADAAVDHGLDRRFVEELTELFEEVRYGKRDSDSREERAIRTLRRIQSTYEDQGDRP